MNEGAKTMGRAGSPRSSFAAKRSTALQSAAGRLPTGLHKRDQALARPAPAPEDARVRRMLPGGGTILDTARARRAPSRSSGSGPPSSASPPLGETTEKGLYVSCPLAVGA